MEIFISVIAVILAFGCLVALLMANVRDRRQQNRQLATVRTVRRDGEDCH